MLSKELADEIAINAIKDQAYTDLNDPKVLKRCVSGCEELIQHSNIELDVKVVPKIDPVKARFEGDVRLDKPESPNKCSLLSGRGTGGAAKNAKGEANVALTENLDTTVLQHVANLKIGGKFEQVSSVFNPKYGQKAGWKVFQIVHKGDGRRAGRQDK